MCLGGYIINQCIYSIMSSKHQYLSHSSTYWLPNSIPGLQHIQWLFLDSPLLFNYRPCSGTPSRTCCLILCTPCDHGLSGVHSNLTARLPPPALAALPVSLRSINPYTALLLFPRCFFLLYQGFSLSPVAPHRSPNLGYHLTSINLSSSLPRWLLWLTTLSLSPFRLLHLCSDPFRCCPLNSPKIGIMNQT